MYRPNYLSIAALSLFGFLSASPIVIDEPPRKSNRYKVKESRYDGAEIRRLNAERGVGSPARVSAEVRARFIASPRGR